MSRDKDKNNSRNLRVLRALVDELRAQGLTTISTDELDAVVTILEVRHAHR